MNLMITNVNVAAIIEVDQEIFIDAEEVLVQIIREGIDTDQDQDQDQEMIKDVVVLEVIHEIDKNDFFIY
jgi:hypothetical protein